MKKTRLYLQMFSLHGLVRGDNLELGRDSDTGGQVQYVVELAKDLSRQDDVARIDLFTRYIADKSVSEDYARTIEVLSDKLRIVRIQCGGRKYLRKELLWPFLDEYIDKTLKFIKRQKAIPDIVHGHYPDAGYVAMHLARIFGIPFVYTGHSLGRSKKSKLLNDGMGAEEINRRYKIDHRIGVEEEIIKHADLIVVSTNQEIEQQYGLYTNRRTDIFRVFPPGLDTRKFYPFYHDMLPETEKDEQATYARASVLQELNRFFMHPDKPLILTLCRPDKRKNIAGLIQAFGESRELQAMANLAVFAGIRKDIALKEESERDVLTQMLLMLDKYDLYGKMAIPKRHNFEFEVPALYRIAADKKGVFVNVALTEPFGLTLLEAAASGLPVVATNDGGPIDIIRNCRNGILVDPTDSGQIADAIRRIISDSRRWEKYSRNGIMNIQKHYTWKSHAGKYTRAVGKLTAAETATDMQKAVPSDSIGKRLVNLNYFLITDIDNTLIGKRNQDLERLLALLEENKATVGFGVATGRTIDSAVAVLKEHGVPAPDVIIASVGTEIYYGKNHHAGQGWKTHISNKWDREKIVKLLEKFSFLEYQEESAQRRFKISYNMAPAKDRLAQIHSRLIKHKCRYNLIYSHQKFMDILFGNTALQCLKILLHLNIS